MTAPVIEEAIKKASIAWVAVGDGPSLGLWCLPLDGALIVVTGPGEQAAPGLADAVRATVRLRGDTGGLIVITEATVARILPGSEDWETVAPQLANKRLNASGTAEDLVTRWVETGCAIVRLIPGPATGRPDLPDTSGNAAPRETPARVEVKRPFRLHKVRGAKKKR